MSTFVVEGKHKLSGSITVSGNKNEALPVIAASLLCEKEISFTNMPKIGDVGGMFEIAEALGATVYNSEGNRTTICTPKIKTTSLPVEVSQRIRGSILFASSLLVREGMAIITQPGGDTIGRRRIDTHFLVFEALGAKIETAKEEVEGAGECIVYRINAPENGLQGADIYLDEASVTATENALIAAAGADGTTVIANAASEPHVQGLCHFLVAMGASIEGIGSNILTVHGRKAFASADHNIGSDYIEAGSIISLAAVTNSDILIKNVDTQHLRMINFQFERLGLHVELNHEDRTIHVPDGQKMEVRKDLGGAIPRLEDAPWPGFPADLTSILLVTATQAKGTCLIHEKMFESRLFFTDKLISMGAQIVLCDPHRAVVVGPANLYGSEISSPDIRAGMALLTAALAAEGKSVIHNIAQIDRGYERIDERLSALGANISRFSKKRRNTDNPLIRDTIS